MGVSVNFAGGHFHNFDWLWGGTILNKGAIHGVILIKFMKVVFFQSSNEREFKLSVTAVNCKHLSHKHYCRSGADKRLL